MIPRIRQIQIRNYKSLQRAVVDLEPFTVLVGPNGAGKSNFLDALMFVQECLWTSFEAALDRRGGQSGITNVTQESLSVGVRFLLDLSEGTRADYSLELQPQGRKLGVHRERCVLETASGKTGFEVLEGHFVREIPGIRPSLSADRLALFAVSALDEFRPIYDFLTDMRSYSIEPGQLRGWQSRDTGEMLKTNGSNAASVLKLLEDFGRHSDERHKRISRLLGKVVPGIQTIGAIESRSGREADIWFHQTFGDTTTAFQSTEMSDGTLRILGLLLAVYQPSRTSVLMIEEPEATVHPAAAELITQVLLSAAQDRQVLITTHSPDILDFKELADQQIRVVSMDSGHTIVAPLSQASRRAIRERLYTPGDLLRVNELNQDVEAADSASQRLELFGEIPSTSH
jgi:predicted ATPase